MTEEELEHLKRRFGADIATWPAPFRQEAQIFLGLPSRVSDFGEDAELDRLILESARIETSERELARRVHERIGQERRPFFRFVPMMSSWQLPVATAGFAAILVAAGVAGYSVAGPGYGRMDDALLALAMGDPIASGIAPGLLVSPRSFGKEDFL